MNQFIVSNSRNQKSEMSLSLLHSESFLFKNFKLGDKTLAACDTFFALLLLLLLAPLMSVIALLVKMNMGGKIIYSQTRVGKRGKLFKVYKFRSMVENAEAATGPMFSIENDPRVTKLGKILRATHFDEFPQLFNVLKGDMSFIGPRPERPEFTEVFEEEVADYNKRHLVKPGITGLAQICLPYDAKAHEKLVYDLLYIANQNSIIFNLLISYYTVLKMLKITKSPI